MEYVIGSIVTVAALFVFSRLLMPSPNEMRQIKIVNRQSRLFELIRPAIPFLESEPELPETQSYRYEDSLHLKVIVSNGIAYWIHENRLYQGDFIDGNIDKESGKIVDTMALSKVELDRMSYIVDRLNSKGGNLDYRNTGNEEF